MDNEILDQINEVGRTLNALRNEVRNLDLKPWEHQIISLAIDNTEHKLNQLFDKKKAEINQMLEDQSKHFEEAI